jgi:hypothetical protein
MTDDKPKTTEEAIAEAKDDFRKRVESAPIRGLIIQLDPGPARSRGVGSTTTCADRRRLSAVLAILDEEGA